MAAACGADESSTGSGGNGDQPLVVVTTSIWADIVANVVCDGDVHVETIVPVGGDPHEFEPSLAARGELGRAALIVANGLSLEAGLDDTLDAVEGEGVPVIRMAEHMDSVEGDPHVWFDPVLVASALPPLADEVIRHTGLDPEAVLGCVAAYESELAILDREIDQLVSTLAEGERKLVTSHDSLGYFARRYGFEVIGTVIPASSGLAETNPAALEELAQLIAATGVKAIFAESQHSTADSDALARRLGEVAVVTLFTGTLGESGSDAPTYVDFMRSNVRAMVAALA